MILVLLQQLPLVLLQTTWLLSQMSAGLLMMILVLLQTTAWLLRLCLCC